MSAVNIVINKR